MQVKMLWQLCMIDVVYGLSHDYTDINTPFFINGLGVWSGDLLFLGGFAYYETEVVISLHYYTQYSIHSRPSDLGYEGSS
jgi:hypothetical protein